MTVKAPSPSVVYTVDPFVIPANWPERLPLAVISVNVVLGSTELW